MSHNLDDNVYLDNKITRCIYIQGCIYHCHGKFGVAINVIRHTIIQHPEKKVDCLSLLCQQQTNWNTKQNVLKYVNVMWRVVSPKPMPWSHFTKGAFPGSSRAVFRRFFGRPARYSEGPRPGAVHFFTPRGPRVTFNSNLKVTWAPARNIPRIKPVNCPAGAQRGPCLDPPRTREQFLWDSTQGTRPPPPYGTLAGAYGILTWLVGGPGAVPPVPSGCSSGSRSGPLYNFQGDTQLRRDEFINVQSINPSIN